jgi:GMP synthase (glutamine-hydrolysing)
MKKYAVITCLNGLRSGNLYEQMIAIFGQKNQHWDVIDPRDANFLDKALDYDGHVISGGPMSVVDDADHPMMKNLTAFVQTAAQRGAQGHSIPVIGLCLGAQLIATAMGGTVGRNPSGLFKLGVDRLEWNAAGCSALGVSIDEKNPTIVIESHGECVTNLPVGTVELASSRGAKHEVFLTNGQFLGIQGHPEVSMDYMRSRFMVYHRNEFNDAQWAVVEQETSQTPTPGLVIDLGRRLLSAGRLPA